MNEPLISIITPTFNTTELIFETFDALKKQTYKNFEWIIVDDGSTDNTLLQELEKDKTLNIKIVYNKKNLGPSFCRNIGAQNAIGEYIMFLDDDDLLPEDHLQKLVNLTENKNRFDIKDSVIYCQTKKFRINDGEAVFHSLAASPFGDFTGLDALGYFMNKPFFNHTGLLIPKKVFLAVAGYDERLKADEDGNIIMKLMMEDYKFIFEGNTFYFYRQHTYRERLSYNEASKNVENRLLSMEILIVELTKRNLIEKYKYDIAMRLDHIALAVCSRNNKKLAKKILSRAEEIMPGYLCKKITAKTSLRRLLGCANYDRFIRVYGYVLKVYRRVKK